MQQVGQHQLLSPKGVRRLCRPHPISVVPLRSDASSHWRAKESNIEVWIKPRCEQFDYADAVERLRRCAVREFVDRSSPSTPPRLVPPTQLYCFEKLISATEW